ncbi:MAG: EboA domain-containing protein [Alphaproteobacteria bacterium]|nr:EboA domain-containing protein [Alphaproteobacteria bacterium]
MSSQQDKYLELLRNWLARQLDEAARAWFDEQLAKAGGADRDLYLAIGLAPRKLGKADLELKPDDLVAADAARPGWNPAGWSVDQAARVALLLTAARDEGGFPGKLEQLCNTADVRELIAFYQGLPLYPNQKVYVARAGEGARTNMKAVFEAVAHRNPYPAENFDEHTWNQLVLKAVFVGSSLNAIHDFDRRRNEDLARTLVDYAHERWAASRVITPELWRAVGPFIDESMLGDMKRVAESDNPTERQAAILALCECGMPGAKALINLSPEILSEVEAGRVSWETVAGEVEKP